MTTRQACMYIIMAIGILVFTGEALQAQIGTGSGSGGAIGQGGPDITKPGKDGEVPMDQAEP